MQKVIELFKSLFDRPLLLVLIALCIVAYSAYLAVVYSHQVPLDMYAFRQTQTALTAFWFREEGIKLAYETPVAGAPWAIPFEFPVYQMLAALFSKVFNFSLDATGRLLSYVFLVLILLPAYSINQRLQLSRATYWVFIAILFSMPVYLYWGRSFMMETAALFFTVMSIKYFLDMLLDSKSPKTAILFMIFASLALLQKATTALPVLIVLSVIYILRTTISTGTVSAFLKHKPAYLMGLYFLVPVLIGYLWVDYSDQVKLLNPLGQHLTSDKLADWNWGTWQQKLSKEIWTKVIWARMFEPNLGAILGVFLVLSPLFLQVQSKLKVIIVISVLLGFLPLFMFTNLHLVHSYYQSANLIFIAYGLAVIIAHVFASRLGNAMSLLLLCLIVTSNYVAFYKQEKPAMAQVFDKNHRDYAIGKILKREVPEGKQFVAFGNDWSSTFGYVAERKSFTVPNWIEVSDQVYQAPEKFVDQDQLGAVVDCSKDANLSHWLTWSTTGRRWKVASTHGCLVVTPDEVVPFASKFAEACEVHLDQVKVELIESKRFITLFGWSAIVIDAQPVIPEKVYLVLSRNNEESIVLDTLQVPRMDVNQHLGVSTKSDAGFSRQLMSNFEPGDYTVNLMLISNEQALKCSNTFAITL